MASPFSRPFPDIVKKITELSDMTKVGGRKKATIGKLPFAVIGARKKSVPVMISLEKPLDKYGETGI